MAAKSDFAQKLLHDLRLRKERMGSSQTSTRSNASTRDAYRNPGNVQRGSRQTKSLESIDGPKTAMSTRGSALAPSINESSQQIVSYAGGRHQRSESVGDLSMAFTYEVKNGGKLMNVDFSGSSNTNTMIKFLQQIGRRSLDAGNERNGSSLVKHRPSNGGGSLVAPALTTVQIKEISKGVQNLYEILRSSSNGANVDRYSMEVGKELLKGAKGLEESLRMLVNLQEASELMVSPQRKSRITLLEVDEDDRDDQNQNQNQVALPRFSFDKPSRRSNLVVADGSSKLPTNQMLDSSSVSTTSNVNNSSSRTEKGRISNVIAKLMGLEEIPGKHVESKNPEPRIQVKKTSKSEKEGLVSLNDRKSHLSQDSNFKQGEFKNPEPRIQVSKTSKLEKDGLVLLNDLKSHQKQDLSTVMVSRSLSTTNVVGTKERLPKKLERQPEYERKPKIQPKRRSPEVAVSLRQERVDKKKATRMEKRNEIKLVPRNNHIQEQEKMTQKSKQVPPQIKQLQYLISSSKEARIQPSEQNPKPKDATPPAQEVDITQGTIQLPVAKEKPVIRKKVDSTVLRRSEAPRTKDEVLKKRNGTLNNLETPSKHKLSVLKETKRKDVQPLVLLRSKPEQTSSRRSNLKISEPTIELDDTIAKETSEIAVAGMYGGSFERIPEAVTLSKNKPKKAFYSSIQVVLTEDEKQLKEILIKDQLFISTAESLFKLNIPVGFLHVDDHNHHDHGTKLKLDCGYEILKRKARSQELSAHPYTKPSIGGKNIRFLDELVKQLYKDLASLRVYGRNALNEEDEADYMHHMLERDIHNQNPDINSFWDFGWQTTTFTLVEKDEFVNDVAQEVFSGLVDEAMDDLLSMDLRF